MGDFKKLFSKKNTTRLQFLESQLMSTKQGKLSISEYFTKIKSICREIGQSDEKSKVGEERMKRIIIHGLDPKYHSFISTIQGWPTQISLLELESLLVNQETFMEKFKESKEKV